MKRKRAPFWTEMGELARGIWVGDLLRRRWAIRFPARSPAAGVEGIRSAIRWGHGARRERGPGPADDASPFAPVAVAAGLLGAAAGDRRGYGGPLPAP